MRIKITLLLLSLGLYLQACRKPQEVVNDKPAIKSISFVGIPQRNVQLDVHNSTITVQLPSLLPKEGLKPVLELVNGASVVRGIQADSTINNELGIRCSCNYSPSNIAESSIVVGNAIRTTYYRLRIIPSSGSLKPLENGVPLSFSRKTNELVLRFPVENLYTNPRITQLRFINLETGVGPILDADATCLNGCSNSVLNQLIFSFSSPNFNLKGFTPGIYKVIADGIEFPQRLVVTE